MKIEYFTTCHQDLFHALRRFCEYVLAIELVPVRSDEIDQGVRTIMVLEEEREHPQLLRLAGKNTRIMVLSYDDHHAVNLLDLAHLEENFLKLLRIAPNDDMPLFKAEELKIRIAQLFKSHGEKSLPKLLNFSLYALNNYTFFSQGGVSFADYNDNFLVPAADQWQKFVGRMEKYSPYLVLMGYQNELAAIREQIPTVTAFLQKTHFERIKQCDEKIAAEIQIILAFLMRIDDFIKKVAADLEIEES